jgi:electron transport complex protein RnfC
VVGDTLVISVEHAVAMVDCLQSGKPFIEKTVTFYAGKHDPLKNFRVRIGTPIGEILKMSGTEPQTNGKLILNGSMRGYACFSDEQPVTSTTDSIHLQEPQEIFLYQNTACVNCGKCNAICPVDLEVNLLGRFSEYGIFDKCRDLGAENCIECGLCAYVCPAHRPLVQLISHAKHTIQTEAIEEVSMEEAMACHACGPVCPAIRLFESTTEEENETVDQTGGKQQE